MVVDAGDTGVLLHLFLVNVSSLRHEEKKLLKTKGLESPSTAISKTIVISRVGSCPTVDASIKMTRSGYSREGSGSRWLLMLVTREFSYISFLLTLLVLGTRRKSF